MLIHDASYMSRSPCESLVLTSRRICPIIDRKHIPSTQLIQHCGRHPTMHRSVFLTCSNCYACCTNRKDLKVESPKNISSILFDSKCCIPSSRCLNLLSAEFAFVWDVYPMPGLLSRDLLTYIQCLAIFSRSLSLPSTCAAIIRRNVIATMARTSGVNSACSSLSNNTWCFSVSST
jgi:hypothetical protein